MILICTGRDAGNMDQQAHGIWSRPAEPMDLGRTACCVAIRLREPVRAQPSRKRFDPWCDQNLLELRISCLWTLPAIEPTPLDFACSAVLILLTGTTTDRHPLGAPFEGPWLPLELAL